ncbi:MAG: hypothetical protein K5907_10060 [Treponema sp.]|nr:hypothetical protein [Treponema sp.]
MKKLISVLASIIIIISFSNCTKNNTIQSISETELFSLDYGNFEEQISVADLNQIGDIRLGIAMKDGFFYIVDGYSKKIMELNSYGDILSLFYNEDSGTSSIIQSYDDLSESIFHEISYPFDYPGQIALDSNKCIYAVCTIPRNRQEQGEGGILYTQAVLRISRDGSSVDYIGQQGPGGTPFPHIKKIYTTQKDELVVVSNSSDGFIVYWFGVDGFLKYMIPISTKNTPLIENLDTENEVYITLENVIPDLNEYKLYLKVDYYTSFVDEESKVQSGINFTQTLLCPLSCETGIYGEPVAIPPYEESIVVDYSKLTYKIPYDFLGVTNNGWKFFIIKTETGFNVEMIQNESQKILHRHFDVNHSDNLFYDMTLSADGIITVLYIDKGKARTVWYRTDTLIDAILKN